MSNMHRVAGPQERPIADTPSRCTRLTCVSRHGDRPGKNASPRRCAAWSAASRSPRAGRRMPGPSAPRSITLVTGCLRIALRAAACPSSDHAVPDDLGSGELAEIEAGFPAAG